MQSDVAVFEKYSMWIIQFISVIAWPAAVVVIAILVFKEDFGKALLIIQFIKVIAWPAVVVFAILVFKKDFSSKVLSRLESINILGSEMKLRKVTRLKENVECGRDEAEVSGTPVSMEENKKTAIQVSQDNDEILKAAGIKPTLGIMQLSSILEREVRTLAINFLGHQHPNLKRPFLKLCKILISGNYLPSHIAKSLKEFWEIRNEIVHGTVLKDDKEIYSVLATGLALLEVIKSIKIPDTSSDI